MGVLATSALSVGSALIGAIVGALINNWYLGISNRRSAQRDSINRLVETCAKLRSVTTQWYERIADEIDPSQPPEQIVDNLRKLRRGGRFQQEIKSHLDILRAVSDDSIAKAPCCRVVEASAAWEEAALQGKRDAASPAAGMVYMAVTTSAELHRLFKRAEEGPEQRKVYLDAVQDRLHLAYGDFDSALDDVIPQLAALQATYDK